MAPHSENERNVSIPLLVVVAVATLIVLVIFGRFCSSAATIDVTVNGAQLTLHGAKTMETAIRESGLPVNPGDLISLNGNVLKKSAGYPFAATVNGEETSDPDFRLHNGDVVVVSDGNDRVEDYDSTIDILPHDGEVGGLGAICTFEPGVDGVLEIRTGRISGEVVNKTKESATSTVCTRYNPVVGDDKVLALTFDEGPSERFTSDVLDVLRENDAKATFFCMGSKAENSSSLVRRERGEGHQVCSMTYSLSWSSILSGKSNGGDIDADRLAEEVERGQQAISDALEGEEPSRSVRLPVSILTGEMAVAVEPFVDADISWNTDTGDWMEYNSEQIYRVLVNADPGDVILLHDGGGDRSATVDALARALPELKREGFSFITIDELMQYPMG